MAGSAVPTVPEYVCSIWKLEGQEPAPRPPRIVVLAPYWAMVLFNAVAISVEAIGAVAVVKSVLNEIEFTIWLIMYCRAMFTPESPA